MIGPASLRNPAILGSVAALAAAFCYGAGALVARKVVSDFASPMVGTAFSMLFGTLIVAALFHRHVAPRRQPRAQTGVVVRRAGRAVIGLGSELLVSCAG